MPKRRQQSEGSVYRRADGRWAAVADLGWRDGRRDRRYFYGATVAEATEKRLRFASRRLDGFTMPKGRPPYTGEWVLHWLHNVVRGRVQDTTWQKSYRQKVEDHIAPWFARVRLSTDDLTEEVVEQWHRHLRARVSGTTAQHCHRLLSAALKEAVIRGRLARNPAANVPAPARSTVEVVPPGEDEVLAILAVCQHGCGTDLLGRLSDPPARDRHNAGSGRPRGLGTRPAASAEDSGWRTGARWVTGIATGIRQGEALGLLWPHVDLDAGTLAVEWELARLPWQHGCGYAEGRAPYEGDAGPKSRPGSGRGASLDECKPGHHGGYSWLGQDSSSLAGRSLGLPLDSLARPASYREPSRSQFPCGRRAASCPLRHSGGLRLKRPKTPASRAAVPLAPFAVAALKRWRVEQAAERLAHTAWTGWRCDCPNKIANRRSRDIVCAGCGRPLKPDLVVFSQPNGRPTDARRDWQDWQDLLAAAGLPASRVHDLRHGFATALWRQGMGMKEISRLMRHANENVTSTIYAHFPQEFNQAAADVIEQAFRKKRR